MALAPDFANRLAATYGNPEAFAKLIFGSKDPEGPGLHAGQRRYAANATKDTNFLLPGNSWGKTEFILRWAFYLAWHKINAQRPFNMQDWLAFEFKGLIASYAYPIARESFDRFLNYYRNRQEVKALVQNVSMSDPPRVTLTNGSIIDWGSLDGQGKLVEAARRRFIMVDEVGHIPDIHYTFNNILYPRTMGVSGCVHLFGTPKETSDTYLLEVYRKGLDGKDPFYYSQEGSVFENEFWTPEERGRVLRNPEYVKGWQACFAKQCEAEVCFPEFGGHPILSPIGKQVILGKFIAAGGYWFNRFYVQRLFTGEHDVEWLGEKQFTVPYQKGRLYMAAFDLGGNKARKRKKPGSDPTVGFLIDYTDKPWKIVGFWYIEGGEADWEAKYELMAQIHKDYRLPYLLIDATGQVDSVVEALQSRGVEVEGVQFGGNSSRKFDMLRNLQLAIEMEYAGNRGLIRAPMIEQLKYELDHYVIPDDGIRQDCVMALAMLAHHLVQVDAPPAVFGELF